MLESLFNKVAGLTRATLLQETLAQVFSYEFCEIFKSNSFIEHCRDITTGYILPSTSYADLKKRLLSTFSFFKLFQIEVPPCMCPLKILTLIF